MAFSCPNNLEVETLFLTRVFGFAFCATAAIPITLLNVLVLTAIWKTSTLHKPSQILLANLALTDLLIGVLACPYMAYLHLAVLNQWFSSYCKSFMILGGFTYFLAGMSLTTLVIISIDRFLAIKFKFSYKRVVTNKCVMIVSLCGWLANITIYLVILLFFANIPWSNLIIFFAVYIAVMLCTAIIFYSMAFKYLRKLSAEVTTHNANNQAPNETTNFDVTKYRRSLHTMVIVLLAILVFYLPQACNSAFQSAIENKTTKHLAILTGHLALFNSCVNPVLYLWRMKDLRQAVKATVREFLCKT